MPYALPDDYYLFDEVPVILAFMAVSVTVLASGSRGNCTLVSSSGTRLLVDTGLSCRELLRRLAVSDEDARAIDAILITHEHTDHVSGLHLLAKKLKIPVYMTAATHDAYRRYARDGAGNRIRLEKLETFQAGCAFQVGDLTVMPFTIPHDAVDPVGFTFSSEGIKVGVCTDLGYMPASVKHHIRGCQVLMIESNHDVEMLRVGPYPWSVKQRVMSRVGHLSNDALADFLTKDYDGGAEFLILAHLSEQNNHPEVARMTAERALGEQQSFVANQLMLATQNEPLPAIRL